MNENHDDAPVPGSPSSAAALRAQRSQIAAQRLAYRVLLVAWAACCGCAAALLAVWPSSGLAAPERISKSGIEYVIDRPASWVLVAEPETSAGQADKGAAPMRHRLLDYQASLMDGAPQRYLHHAVGVLTTAAVEQAGNVPIRFSPDTEHLTLHTLAILRAGKRIDKLHTARMEVLREEPGREQFLYDGVVTVDFLLDDVRAGDTVDVAYTITGSNGVDGEKFNSSVPLAYAEPVDDLRVRVLFPTTRPLHYKVLHAEVTPRLSEEAGRRELLVRRQQVPAIDIEPSTAVDDMPVARLRLSEYDSWAEVAQWADTVYRVPDDLSSDLRQVIAEIRSHSVDDADAVRRALLFVQTEVRYVGIEIGEGSFRPAHPNVVLERRYGDCKDKALLLSAMLRALGYKAHPALVSAFIGRDARDVTPMPRLFNHMIVMAEVHGERYWLDATRTFQQGTLERIGNPRLHWALVTGQGSDALTRIADGKAYEQKIQLHYQFAVHDYRDPVSLTMTETYTGILAENLRGVMSSAERQKLLEENTRNLARSYTGIAPIGELEVSDDTERNALTLTARYTVPEFIEAKNGRGAGRLYAGLIHMFAEPPVKLTRIAPLALPHPFAVQIDLDVEFPEDVRLHASQPVSIADDNVEFAVRDSYGNKRLHVEYRLATRRAEVPVKQVKAYADVLRQIRERVAYIFPVSSPISSIAPRKARLSLPAPENSEDESTQVAAALDREQQGKVRTLSDDIDSGRLQGKPLAEALVDRAVAHSNLDRADQAITDLSRAIEVDPQAARAYTVRGEVYSIRGNEQKRALDDFARALQLDPKRDVYMSRGRAYFFEGNYRAAQADFKRAAEQNNNEEQLHALIWLYFATQRLGEDGRAVIAGVPSRANLSQWPGSVVMMLLGNATTEEMLSAAWSFERKTELLQRCEAYFFLGEYRLSSGDADAARAAFNESFATGVKYYVEYAYSRLELARLGASDAEKRAGK